MLDRREKYEPGDKVIALFPVNAYRHRGPRDVSKRATKLSVGEVMVVHGDDREKWDGLLVRRTNGLHYIVYSRGDLAVAPEPHMVAWAMVDGQIARGQIIRLQARLDEAVAEVKFLFAQRDNEIIPQRDALLKERDEARAKLAQAEFILNDAEGRLDYRRAEAATYRQERNDLQQLLDEANQEVEHLKDAASADRQIMQGEQFLLKKALDYLEKLYGVLKDADEDFNFSGDHDPDGAPDA